MKDRSDTELLAWQAAIIQEQQKPSKHSIVQTHIRDGKIVRVVVEESRMPPR